MPLLNVDERVLIVDATGAAMGTSGNPIFTAAAASPGTTNIQGTQANGATPITANPVLVGASDGANLRNIKADTAGNLIAVGPTAAGAAITQAPLLVAGQFGGNVKLLGLDTNGGVTQGAPNAGGTSSWPVQGAAAAGAALAGNPLRLGISDGTNIQDWKQTTSGTGTQGIAGIPIVTQGLSHATNDIRAATTWLAATDGSAGGNIPANGMLVSNGTTLDRFRNNVDVTLLASAARTTTQTSADITTFNLAGITVVLDMTVVAASPSVTLTINGKDPASGKYYNLLTGAAVVAITTNVYRIMPALTAVANKDVNAYLPRTIQIVVTANNANSGTYSVGYTLHNV